MNKLIITYPTGATTLTNEERLGLIPDYISTMGELNKLEQANIAEGLIWAEKQNLNDLLTATFVLELHKRMLGDIWEWAGKLRRSNKSIGIAKEDVMNNLKLLLDDTKFRIENRSYPIEEIAIRFHHRLVEIHVFTNGNGRHARLITNLLLKSLNFEKFTWGSKSNPTPIEAQGKTRALYVDALKKADKGDMTDLLTFAES